MHICIIGTGAAGWLACNLFAKNQRIPNINKITIVGSPEIPPIGVGESNTLVLNKIHHTFGVEMNDFVSESDASIKYGVYYRGWSKNDFLHFFKGDRPWADLRINLNAYGKLLANKSTDCDINSIYGKYFTEIVNQNKICLDQSQYPISWHFDAGKYIQYLSNNALKNSHVEMINDTLIDCVFSQNETIEKLILKSGNSITADYYIIATGSSEIVSNLLKEEYHDLSDILLTDSAFVYPLKYKNKPKQFHPYTIAKTMKCGWRWITPTYSRIGTGYVFSSKHISVDDAKKEFLSDIGDQTLEPNFVKFQPRYNKKTFKNNYCTIGMANGFLEPLDAPGLTLSIIALGKLETLLIQKFMLNDKELLDAAKNIANRRISDLYEFWASFILCQYKTCHRNDTQFWKDHKKVYYQPYEYIVKNLDRLDDSYAGYMMFYHTIAAKDIQWNSKDTEHPFKVPEFIGETMDHLDYINHLRNNI